MIRKRTTNTFSARERALGRRIAAGLWVGTAGLMAAVVTWAAAANVVA